LPKGARTPQFKLPQLHLYAVQHAGLGEEWEENDNAGTAAEAQAFKRACSCFGLGRYLYDLEGQWVDRCRPHSRRFKEWQV